LGGLLNESQNTEETVARALDFLGLDEKPDLFETSGDPFAIFNSPLNNSKSLRNRSLSTAANTNSTKFSLSHSLNRPRSFTIPSKPLYENVFHDDVFFYFF
jgi:hypothetical protein